MSEQSLYEYARTALESGINVWPPRQDGSKAPDGSWKAAMDVLTTAEQLKQFYDTGERTGIGFICGTVSGGLEMFEFEGRAVRAGLFDDFLRAAESSGLGELVQRIRSGYEETTPSGGVHWLYRSDVSRSVQLAVADEGVLIETRGEGGYVIVAPSHGSVHKTRKSWELVRGGVETIVTISKAQRDLLFDLARTFDERPRPAERVFSDSLPTNGLRPGQLWAEVTSFSDILRQAGWQYLNTTADGNQHWVRPGKDSVDGASATVGNNGEGPFYCFTSSVPELQSDRAYDKFGLYTFLNFGGDFSASARALVDLGFTDKAPNAPTMYALTDVGNAQRFVDRFHHLAKWVAEWAEWIIWDGCKWIRDLKGAVVELAKASVRTIYEEAAAEGDPDRRAKLAKWATSSESSFRIEGLLRLARTDPKVAISIEDLDPDPYLLNVANGVIDLRSGTLMEHDPALLQTKLADSTFEMSASSPVFDSFLERVIPDPDVRVFLQTAFGYALLGEVREQVLIFLLGNGANGKSTLTSLVQSVFGSYATQAEPELLLARQGAHPTGVADLLGSRLVICSEVEAGRSFAEVTVKQLTGGDKITARRMRQDFFQFDPSFTIFLCANHKPIVRGTDNAIWRRILLVPFAVTIPTAEQDPTLKTKLMAERSGILSWLLEGCARYLREGLSIPAAISGATDDYRSEMDMMGNFIDEECVVEPFVSCSVANLYSAYESWCTANGVATMSKMSFSRALAERGFERARTNTGRMIKGIAITSDRRGDIYDAHLG